MILVIVYFALERLIRSPWGRVLKSIPEDEEVSSALGKNVFWYRLQSLMIGSAIAGLAGGLTLSAVQIPSDFAMRVTNAKKEIYYPVAYAVSAFCWIGTIILS